MHSASLLDPALRLIETGAAGWPALDIVQVRGVGLPAADLETLAGSWIDAVSRHGIRVVVNDRLDVALAAGADGVHVGRSDLRPAEFRERVPASFLIGMSAHSPGEIELAEASGAGYVGLGAFFASRTKPEAAVLDRGRVLDLGGNGRARPEPAIPVLAIGGITAPRVPEAFSVPAVTGIAASEAVQGSDDPAEAALGLRAAIDAAWTVRGSQAPA